MHPLGFYRRPMPRVLGVPRGVSVFLWARDPCRGFVFALRILCFVIRVPGIGRKVDVRLPEKGTSNSHGARPVELIIPMI